MNRFNIGKRGQVGDTVTWIIATVIIVLILMFFVFGASALGGTKSVSKFKKSFLSGEEFVGEDIFMKKTLFSYVMIKESSVKAKIDRNFKDSSLESVFGKSYDEYKAEIVGRYESVKK